MDHNSLPILVRAWGLPQGSELIIIMVIALLLFGHKLPSLMRGLGGSIKEFKKGMDEGDPQSVKKPEVPEGSVSRDAVSKAAVVPPEAGKPSSPA